MAMAKKPGSYGKPGMGPKKGTGSKPKAKTFGAAFKEARKNRFLYLLVHIQQIESRMSYLNRLC